MSQGMLRYKISTPYYRLLSSILNNVTEAFYPVRKERYVLWPSLDRTSKLDTFVQSIPEIFIYHFENVSLRKPRDISTIEYVEASWNSIDVFSEISLEQLLEKSPLNVNTLFPIVISYTFPLWFSVYVILNSRNDYFQRSSIGSEKENYLELFFSTRQFDESVPVYSSLIDIRNKFGYILSCMLKNSLISQKDSQNDVMSKQCGVRAIVAFRMFVRIFTYPYISFNIP